MGLISFIKNAGEKLFGIGEAKAEAAAPNPSAANDAAGAAIADYINKMGLKVDGLDVKFDGGTSTVTVAGVAADQATKEKVVLCCGNVANVGSVSDLMTVAAPAEPEAKWHTVVSGDNLSKIAKSFYGDANKYPVIFEANKPMLTHPDKIYPGQVLRIPALT